MPEITREYCLGKIAELINKLELYDEPEALADYFLLLACWRWLADLVVDQTD